MTEHPLSTWSSVFYMVGGAVATYLFPGPTAGTALLAFVLLTVGTGLFHADWNVETANLDHFGMLSLFLYLLALFIGLPWWGAGLVGFGLGAGLTYITDSYSHPVVGLLVLLSLLGAATESIPLAIISLVLLGGGLAVRTNDDVSDVRHSIWHLLTSGGLTTILLAFLGM